MNIGKHNREWNFRRYGHQAFNSTANARGLDNFTQEMLAKIEIIYIFQITLGQTTVKITVFSIDNK